MLMSFVLKVGIIAVYLLHPHVQGVSGGIVNILGGGSMNYSE